MSHPMSHPILRLQNVCKVFKSSQGLQSALRDVSFEVKEGEVISLIGPSGSGKSTCLRTINALETVTSGEIEVCGIDYRVSGPSAALQIRRNTGMVFQRFELFPHMTALENVALGPRLVLSLPKAQAHERAHAMLAQVGLEEHSHKYPRMLSGGQQQRVAIARALVLKPRIFLCDEPTSALDPELVDEVVDILLKVAQSGVTMLVVTHELSFARRISSRCLFFEKGEIREQGPTEKLFTQPETPRLQQFLTRIRHDYA